MKDCKYIIQNKNNVFVLGALALRAMHIEVPEAAKAGESVTLSCDYDLESAALYTIKWYRGDEEFYRYVPKESPPTRVFPMPAVNVDVSDFHSNLLCFKCQRYNYTNILVKGIKI